MIRLCSITMVVLAMLVSGSGLVAAADAPTDMKHSGVLVFVDDTAGTIHLAEIGPWRVRDGTIVVTYRTIVVTPATEFAAVTRVPDAPSGFRDDFAEMVIDRWDLYAGDHVTVDCRHEGDRLVALKITVVGVSEP